jgi:hypothetical protein
MPAMMQRGLNFWGVKMTYFIEPLSVDVAKIRIII